MLRSAKAACALIAALITVAFFVHIGSGRDTARKLLGKSRTVVDRLVSGRLGVISQSDALLTAQKNTTSRHCELISLWHVSDVVSGLPLSKSSDPFFLHFEGATLAQRGAQFRVGTQICTIFLVPQLSPNATRFQNAAVDGWGPDSIHAEVISEDVRLTLQSPRFQGFLSIPGASIEDNGFLGVYASAYALYHPGHYEVVAEVEFRNNDWVMEDNIDLTEVALPYTMLNDTMKSKSGPISVVGTPVSRPTDLCYHDGNNDLHGRWYRASSFTSDGNQTALNPKARLEFAEHNATVDKWGWTFAPDHCSLTFFSAEDHLSCLNNKTIQVLGDSNSRRVLKSIIGGGISWCQDHNERMCQCEDHWETEIQDVLWNTLNATYFKDTEARSNPIKFGRNSSAYFDFIGGLVNQKLFNSWSFFYDSSPGSPSIITKRIRDHGPIDVVHVSVIGWDMASVRSSAEWSTYFENFRHKLHSAYPEGTRFVHRLANSNCCGNLNHKTRYSAPRFAIWNSLYRQWWANDENAGIHRIIDVTALQGRRDAETQYYCPTTHMRSSHVRVEQMMWMSAVCEKDQMGTARMRDGWGLIHSKIHSSPNLSLTSTGGGSRYWKTIDAEAEVANRTEQTEASHNE